MKSIIILIIKILTSKKKFQNIIEKKRANASIFEEIVAPCCGNSIFLGVIICPVFATATGNAAAAER